MKKRNVKRVLAMAIACAMTAGALTGCSGKAQRKESGENDGAESQAENKPDTWIADRTITVQAYVDDIGNTLPKDLNNTPTMKKITELTGIKLDIKYTPGDSDAKVLASQLASGTVPDVIVSYLDNSTRLEFPLLLKAAKEGIFADVSGYMRDSKVYSRYYEDHYLPWDSNKNITFRDDLDGVYLWQMNVDATDKSMVFNPQEDYRGGMYVQKSIMDKLGIDEKDIKTQDDFYELLVKIKEGGFTDKNGNQVYPLGPKYWGGSVDTLQYVCPGLRWGVSKDYNIDTDGKVKHEAERDSIYDEINYIRKLIDEGLMNPEFFTMDSTRAQEACKSYNSAIIADVHNYTDIIYQTDDWIPLGPLNDIQGDDKRVTHGKTARGCMAISAKADHPEEIFQFFDWLSTKEGQMIAQYGAKGVSYDLVDGKPVLKEEVLQALDDGNMDYLLNHVGAGFGGSGNYFFEFVLTDKDNTNNFGEARPGASANNAFARSVKIAAEYPYEMKMIDGLDAPSYLSAKGLEDVKMQMDLLSWNDVIVQACFAKSEEEVKNIIESFRNQLKAAGIDKFESYVQDVYSKDKEAVNFYN